LNNEEENSDFFLVEIFCFLNYYLKGVRIKNKRTRGQTNNSSALFFPFIIKFLHITFKGIHPQHKKKASQRKLRFCKRLKYFKSERDLKIKKRRQIVEKNNAKLEI